MKKYLILLFLCSTLQATPMYYVRQDTTTWTSTMTVNGAFEMYNSTPSSVRNFLVKGGSITLTGTVDNYDISNQFSSVAASSNTLYGIIQSTRTGLLDVIASSYTTNRTSITALEVSTGALRTDVDANTTNITENYNDIVSLKESTGTLDTVKLDKSSATITYLFKNEKATDSDKLDNLDSDYFAIKTDVATSTNAIQLQVNNQVSTHTAQTISGQKEFTENTIFSTIIVSETVDGRDISKTIQDISGIELVSSYIWISTAAYNVPSNSTSYIVPTGCTTINNIIISNRNPNSTGNYSYTAYTTSFSITNTSLTNGIKFDWQCIGTR